MLGGDEEGKLKLATVRGTFPRQRGMERDEETSLRTYASHGAKGLRGTICVSFP